MFTSFSICAIHINVLYFWKSQERAQYNALKEEDPHMLPSRLDERAALFVVRKDTMTFFQTSRTFCQGIWRRALIKIIHEAPDYTRASKYGICRSVTVTNQSF